MTSRLCPCICLQVGFDRLLHIHPPPPPPPPVAVEIGRSFIRVAWNAQLSHDLFYQLQVARLDPALGLQHYETCYTGRQTEFLIDELPQHGWEVPVTVGTALG